MSAMQLDAIETSFLDILSSLSEILDNFLNLFNSQGMRHFMRDSASWDVDITIDSFSKRGNRLFSEDMLWVACSTTVPNLEEDFSALSVHSFSDSLPSFYLLIIEDAGWAIESIAISSNGSAFSQNKSSTGSSWIIFHMKIIGNSGHFISSYSSECSNYYSIFKLKVS